MTKLKTLCYNFHSIEFFHMKLKKLDDDGFTYSRFGVYMSSRHEAYDDETASIHFIFGKHVWRLEIPDWVCPPHKETRYNSYTKKDYIESIERMYGIVLSKTDTCFHIYYGIQDQLGDLGDKTKYKSVVWFIPWLQWDYAYTEYLTPDRSVQYTNDNYDYKMGLYIKENIQKMTWKVRDETNDTVVTASAFIERTIWRRGTGTFSWLRHFYKPMVRTWFKVDYSDEVGTEKGSWKGGYTGTNITLDLDKSNIENIQYYYENFDKDRRWGELILIPESYTEEPVTVE